MAQTPTPADVALRSMRAIAEAIRSEATRSHPDDQKIERLAKEFDRAEEDLKEAERAALLEGVQSGKYKTERVTRKELDDDPFGEPRSIRGGGTFSNPWDPDALTGRPGAAELRARALSAVERAAGAHDGIRQTLTDFLEHADDRDGNLARLVLATSDPAYMSAFRQAAMEPTPMFSQAEVEAVRRVRAEARAMGLTDSAGGFLIPAQLDPTVVLTSDGSTNPIRQLARKVIATGDVWHGVSSAAVAWSWDAEAEQVSDDAPTLAGPQIPIHAARGFVPISIEAFEDAANVAGEVGRLIAFGKDTLESAAFTVGTGSGEPTGIIQALAVDSGTSVVAATTDNAFGSPDVYKLDEALPARYRANGSWLAHRVLWNDISQFETSNGSKMFPEVYGARRLLGRPIYEASDMDSTYATGNNYCLVFGDFSHYVVADRIGTRVEFIPHLFSTGNNRPTGQRGWFAWYRSGSDSLNDGAFRVLDI